MAKKTAGVTFTNATIDIADDTITEFKKDETIVSSLSAFLKEWDGQEGITLSVRQDSYTAITE